MSLTLHGGLRKHYKRNWVNNNLHQTKLDSIKNNRVVFVSGNFNIIHPGHLRLLHFAKELGNKLIVGVFSDRLAGSAAHVSEALRLDNIKSISWVAETFLIDEPISSVITNIRPDIVVKGKEYEGIFNAESDAVAKYGGRVMFSSGEAIFSSFDLIQKELQKSERSFNKIPRDYLERHALHIEQMRRRVKDFSKLKVLVIGDLIIDEYITCDPLGMSQEDPTIVVTPVDSILFIGGAGIVAAHAAGLGAKVNFLSFSGNDKMREFAIETLNSFNVNAILNIDDSRPTTLKQRFRCKGKTLLRVSHLHQGLINAELQEIFIKQIEQIIDSIDLVIFSDFNYGCLPNPMVSRIIKICGAKDKYMVADSQSSSQVGDISRFQNMGMLTPTEHEARLSVQDYESGLVVLAEKLRNKAFARNILLKIGGDGVLIHAETDKNETRLTDKIPALNSSPKDVAGAGDSMLITGAMALACGAKIWESAALGSIAAAIQVSRVGNLPLQSTELLDQLQS